MARRPLTANERRVLYGLVRHPTHSDRGLSKILDIKGSTVTAIRRRLHHAGCFVSRRIPMLHRAGWEILAAGHGQLSPTRGPGTAERMRELLRSRFPTFVHVTESPDHFIFIACAPSYTTFCKDFEEFRIAMYHANLIDEAPIPITVFPVGSSVLGNFFDFSQILAHSFDLSVRPRVRLDPLNAGDVRLTRKEKDVLAGLVKHPELSDHAVAERIGASRSIVSKMRRNFESRGLLKTVRLPNIRVLGFEVYSCVFSKLAPDATLRARSKAIERTLRSVPQFFYVASNLDSVLLGAVRSYEHFSSLRSNLMKYHGERKYLAEDATVYLGLTSMTTAPRNCDFGPLADTLTRPLPTSQR